MAELLILAGAVFLYAQVSERLAMSPVTAPMVFTTVGLVTGAGGLDWFDIDAGDGAVEVLVEGTLVLVLFTDATRIDLEALGRESWLPARLLGIGLPLTFVAGTAVATVVLTELSLVEAALVAAILSPTDAALGQAVVSDSRLPVRLRQGLNVESGLNDGIVLPLVTVLLAVAAGESGRSGVGDVGAFVAEQIGYGVVAGALIGALGGVIIRSNSLAGRIEGVYRQLATISVAVGAFAAAALVGGNGFIAAFVAGLAFGRVARRHCDDLQDFTEDEGELLTVITFTVFGAILVGPLLDDLTWAIALYAVLSLTLVRMVPVAVAMLGTGTLAETRLFVGWFGPRGLASILFGIVMLEELEGDAAATEVFLVVGWTVLVSVFAHGVTASPWTGRLAATLAAGPDDMPEMESVPELPTRRRLFR